MGATNFFAALIGLIFFGHIAHAPAIPAEITPTPAISTSAISTAKVDSKIDAEKLAKCLAKNGVIMYGAYWCPHCANQKQAFGDAAKFLPYNECDPKGPKANPKACEKAQVKGYPTWVFPHHSKVEGESTLEDLAVAGQCSQN